MGAHNKSTPESLSRSIRADIVRVISYYLCLPGVDIAFLALCMRQVLAELEGEEDGGRGKDTIGGEDVSTFAFGRGNGG